MKAGVLHELGTMPKYEDFPDPAPQNADELLMTVKAASIKNLDKARASGKHYASHGNLPAIVGIDGVGILEDGTRVYAQGITGMLAEKALINRSKYVELPNNISDATAAALPNAVLGAALALRYRAKIKAGNVVLINGATGVTGQLAVQIAKYYGASKVIATGRNTESLERLKTMGADVIVPLKQDDAALIEQLKSIYLNTPIDIVIDYLWAHPMELILASLKSSGLNKDTHPVRVVTVGSMAGENINLTSGSLRSADIEILGSGFGSLSQAELKTFNTEALPEMFQLAADKLLTIETETADLKDIETAWKKEVSPGKRLVVLI